MVKRMLSFIRMMAGGKSQSDYNLELGTVWRGTEA